MKNLALNLRREPRGDTQKCKNAKIQKILDAKNANIFVENRKMENVQIEENTEFKARHLRNHKQSLF